MVYYGPEYYYEDSRSVITEIYDQSNIMHSGFVDFGNFLKPTARANANQSGMLYHVGHCRTSQHQHAHAAAPSECGMCHASSVSGVRTLNSAAVTVTSANSADGTDSRVLLLLLLLECVAG
jgi:hypothetical protein